MGLYAGQTHSASMVSSVFDLCALSSKEDIAKSVSLACQHIEQLRPQVVSAAHMLFKAPNSQVSHVTYPFQCGIESYSFNDPYLEIP